MDDKDFFLKAETEFESSERDEALWLKSLTLDQGDEGKAKYTYIKLRVEELTLSSNKTIKKDDKKIKLEDKNLDNLDNDREFLLAIFGAFVFMIVLILGLGAY